MRKLILALALFAVTTNASASPIVLEQTQSESKYKEVQVINVPDGTKLHKGKTRNGNDKYWIEMTASDGTKTEVSVGISNAEKYMNGEISLQIVKKQNTETGKIYYYSRQNRTKTVVKDVDLDKVKF